MKIKRQYKSPLSKTGQEGISWLSRRHHRFYGPTAQQATKVALGIVKREGAESEILERWYATDRDLRSDEEVAHQISALLREHQVLTVAMVDRIIGCPHEEGVDYPDGELARTVHTGSVGIGSRVS